MADPWYKPLASRHGRGKIIYTFLSKGAEAPFEPPFQSLGQSILLQGQGIFPVPTVSAATSLPL